MFQQIKKNKKKPHNTKSQRGVSLFLITVMIAVLISFSLSVAFIIIGSTKITSNVADSVKAFHCADSGIEYALCRIGTACRTTASLSQLDCQASPGTHFEGTVNDSNFTFTGYAINSNPGTCGANTTIEATGNYRTGARKIQVTY